MWPHFYSEQKGVSVVVRPNYKVAMFLRAASDQCFLSPYFLCVLLSVADYCTVALLLHYSCYCHSFSPPLHQYTAGVDREVTVASRHPLTRARRSPDCTFPSVGHRTHKTCCSNAGLRLGHLTEGSIVHFNSDATVAFSCRPEVLYLIRDRRHGRDRPQPLLYFTTS